MAAVILFVPKLRGATDDEYGNLPLRSKLDRMDPVGAALFIGAVCCLLLALTWGGQTYAWGSSRIVGLFVGFGAVTALFCFWLWRRGETALIPLRVLRKRSICMGALILFGMGIPSQVVG